MKKLILLLLFPATLQAQSWVRTNLLGYPTTGIKTAVWCSKTDQLPKYAVLMDEERNKVVMSLTLGPDMGTYGPFHHTARIGFTQFTKPGRYHIEVDGVASHSFRIDDSVYKGTADFCLRYMRQQRTGFNPSLKDSCHTHDGYTLYGPMPDSTHIDVVGGWHDASDYLQYSTTSANATWHLLAAYRDFRSVFTDQHRDNGLEGENGIPDVMDEARWGLQWLLKMNPADEMIFNQLGDDRDHRTMRMPRQDTNFYGKGLERPVYFVNGLPQQRGKFMNTTTGVSSIAGKFSSTFSLAADLIGSTDADLTAKLRHKASSAYAFGRKKPGYAQTVSVLSPYIYAEQNWADDMELAAAGLGKVEEGLAYAHQEPLTPWLGKDTAAHYQWYPFINVGHYELAKAAQSKAKGEVIDLYKQGIELVWNKAKRNAFLRGIPFVWCSNNFTTSFAIQCHWYRELSGDNAYAELEQANIDWLFGVNPWGTSMVYGLPADGDTPVDPHSAFTHIGHIPIDGGLVDGPVYTSIYSGLIGIQLFNPDVYAEFQSNLAVYHDDYGDYSTNEPTMDGTASLIYLLAAKESEATHRNVTLEHGAYTRSDSMKKEVTLVFTADEAFEGLPVIRETLRRENVPGSFFFTGRMYRNVKAIPLIRELQKDGQFLGAHSDQHLLYADWTQRDSTLVTRDSLIADLRTCYAAMDALGIVDGKRLFIPPYEWWNRRIADWCHAEGVQLMNFTSGIRSNADYTWPEMGKSYVTSDAILKHLKSLEVNGQLNGAVLLIHAGTDPRRKDKLYNRLPELIAYLRKKGYTFKKVNQVF